MDAVRIEKAIAALEREMIASNRRRHSLREFAGVALLHAQPRDSFPVQSLVGQYNAAARSYNALGRQMGRLVQNAINTDAWEMQRNLLKKAPPDLGLGPIPFVMWCLSVFDGWLRTHSAPTRSVFLDVEPDLHLLEVRMRRLRYGRDGLHQLEQQIAALRGTPHR